MSELFTDSNNWRTSERISSNSSLLMTGSRCEPRASRMSTPKSDYVLGYFVRNDSRVLLIQKRFKPKNSGISPSADRYNSTLGSSTRSSALCTSFTKARTSNNRDITAFSYSSLASSFCPCVAEGLSSTRMFRRAPQTSKPCPFLPGISTRRL